MDNTRALLLVILIDTWDILFADARVSFTEDEAGSCASVFDQMPEAWADAVAGYFDT